MTSHRTKKSYSENPLESATKNFSKKVDLFCGIYGIKKDARCTMQQKIVVKKTLKGYDGLSIPFIMMNQKLF
jgi:hypothetical protein